MYPSSRSSVAAGAAGQLDFSNMARKSMWLLLAIWLQLALATGAAQSSPCPWSSQQLTDLENSCTCDYNLAYELAVQCDYVDFNQLLQALRRYASQQARIDILYVNNSTVGTLRNNTFQGLRVVNLQLSGCKIKTIENNAFAGQENTLRNLNLRDNELHEVPRQALTNLKNLTILDLSKNKINRVPEHCFLGHRLNTLKLIGNAELQLETASFRGLESTLKNLNLMGTRQRKLPEALRGLKALAFLDLSQNSIRELGGSNAFQGLNSLTGLNLERNLIQSIGPDAFAGVSSTLSSLSLLNNLIPEFPTSAISILHELKVLDIGFNLMTELPIRAFEGNPSLTLLAIDGNPLSTVPQEAFAKLNGTLRGLSLGGRFLVCDCKLRWIVDWMKSRDLQVTSRESKPQFCGSPKQLHDRAFDTIKPEEMTCDRQSEIVGIGTVESVEPTGAILEAIESQNTQHAAGTHKPSTVSSRPTNYYETTSTSSSTSSSSSTVVATHMPTTLAEPSSPSREIVATKRPGNIYATRNSPSNNPRHPLVQGSPSYTKRNHPDISIKDALNQDSTLIIRWESNPEPLHFKVAYRLFGDPMFKVGPQLNSNEREFKIKSVPPHECLIVCVIDSADIAQPTPANVPFSQCREVRTDGPATSNMDKITIAASASICLTILAAILIFFLISRRRRHASSRKLHTLQEPGKLPIAGLPVNCCSSLVGPTPSPGGGMGAPLPGIQGTLSAYSVQKEWDQLSAYSTRSRNNIPRPKMFPVERNGSVTRASCLDDGGPPGGPSSMNGHPRGHYYPGATLGSSLAGLGSRQDLRHSRQSLASRNGGGCPYPGGPGSQSSARRQRPRSRTNNNQHHQQQQQHLPRPGSRYSLAESTHTLNRDYEESNWTDHDMDIYMARNPTTRGGLVPL
uniref:LRRCT domain-containing protein n=1 Tax=Trichogramma kaykai TaxID=54128 RepID=A0ABD2XEQ8_9HYME